MKLTINEALETKKFVEQRLLELKTILQSGTTRQGYVTTAGQVTTEVLFDIKQVDRLIMKLEAWKLDADSKIKQSNAVTYVEIDGNKDDLMVTLE